MNADRLLHAFSMIGEDPARIQQMRQVAVALAIGGKLNTDAPALSPREMLRAVEQVKADLYKQRAIPKPKNLKSVEQDELPENFPDAGRFAPLGRVARVEKGLTGIKQAQPGPFPLVVTGAERATCDHFDFDGAAAIVPLVSSTGHGHASLNRLHYQEGKFALGTILAAVFPYDPALVSARFIFEYLSAFKDELLVTRMTGTANVTLSVGRIAEVPIPLIDPATQAMVDELMALLDRLEAARTQREATRDRLTAAGLARLTVPDSDPTDFPANARFALAKLPALTTRPDQIKPLRQTILNLAVRGKLVEQDPIDEPASEMLKSIAVAKAAAKGRKGARAKGVPAEAESADADVPTGWTPVRLDDVAVSMRYGTSIKCDYDKRLVPVLRIPNVSSGQVVLDDIKFGPLSEADREVLSLEADDLLMIRSNGSLDIVGRAAVVPPEAVGMAFAGYLVRLQTLSKAINSRYVWLALNSSAVREQIERPIRSAVGLKNVNLTEFGNLSFWLPPLAEQHRIVTKVDALMALCDRLEAALTTTDTTRARLLEALLHEALEPSQEALEAAE